MGKIYCVIGKSSTGKDSIYKELIKRESLKVKTIVPYTTRPVREGEREGEEYHFVEDSQVEEFARQQKIIELRAYDTVYGIWKYFTVDDGQIDLEQNHYLYILTLEGYIKLREYFGENRVVPIYVEVEDGERLIRAIRREQTQAVPKYEEMCRRFLADAKDFSEELLQEAGIQRRFVNDDFEKTVEEIVAYIKEDYEG